MATTEPIRTLGRFELLKRIAKGGMGEIYLARSRGAGGFEKTFIIKTILEHLAEEEEFVTKFLDEGRIVVQLVHGNIVPVFDMGEEDGEYFIAMEYIPGRDLREVTKRLAASGDVMPVDLALFITSEVCKGLHYAHRKTDEQGEPLGIVHRDVSPSNVLISREGEVKIIDFGIARAAGRLGKTVSGRIQGKFCYMSPEQASGAPLDSRSDIFSAGVVLYELLTGFRPFEGDSDLKSLDLVRKCEFDPPSTLNPDVPDEVDELVAKALARDPDERFQTIERLQIEALQYLYTTGTSPTPSELADFLADLFPGGLEREELRSARDSKPKPGKMSLDDALDFELQRLVEDDDTGSRGGIDPLETTAVSSESLDQLADETRTRAAAPAAKGPSGDGTEESAEESTTDTSTEVSVPAADTPSRARWAGAAVVVVLLIAAAVYATTRPAKGRVHVESEPEGAQILVDGAIVLGAKTPHTLRLEGGEHQIRLELAGYEDRTISVAVSEGEEQTVSGEATRLDKIETPEGPRTFRITAVPEDAVLSVDGDAQFGTGSGATLVVKPGEVARVTASHEGCRRMLKQVSHAQPEDEVHFDLACDVADDVPDAGAEPEVKEEPRTDPPANRRVRFQIKSQPEGAEIFVNGQALGAAPAVWSGAPDAKLVVEAKKAGFEPLRVERSAKSVRGALTLKLSERAEGCLTLRLMNPFVAEVSVGGKSVGRVSSKLDPYTVPAGKHRLRVHNEAVGLDHSREVTIEPGKECTHVVVDGAKL